MVSFSVLSELTKENLQEWMYSRTELQGMKRKVPVVARNLNSVLSPVAAPRLAGLPQLPIFYLTGETCVYCQVVFTLLFYLPATHGLMK
jgi:hypothetical protein